MGDGGEYGDVSSGNELLARSQSRGESSERDARGEANSVRPLLPVIPRRLAGAAYS